jgi:hypothetical protein
MEKEKTAQAQQNRNFQFHIISWPITKTWRQRFLPPTSPADGRAFIGFQE